MEPPDIFLGKLYSKISYKYKYTFVVSIVFSVLTHFYYFVNHFFNFDGINALFALDGRGLSRGRWFQDFAKAFSTNMDLSYVAGLMAFLAIALTTCLTVSLTNIKKKTSITLLAAIYTTFPVITATFTFKYASDIYMISMLLSTLSAYLSTKFTKGFILGGIILGLAAGIYQIYLTYFVSLISLLFLLDLLNKQRKLKQIFHKIIKLFLTFSLGLLVYFIGLKISLRITGMSLTSYQYVNRMGKINFSYLPNMFINTYMDLYKFFFTDRFISPTLYSISLFLVMFTLLFYFLIRKIVSYKIHKDKLRLSLLIITVSMLPVFLNSVIFIGAEFIYMLMVISYIHVFALFISLLDMNFNENINTPIEKLNVLPIARKQNRVLGTISLYIGVIVLILISHNFYLIDNKTYLASHIKYENTFAFVNRLVQRIENVRGYNRDKQVAIVGNAQYPETIQAISELKLYTGFPIGNGLIDSRPHKLRIIINHWIGLKLKEPDSFKITEIMESEDFHKMPLYPAKDSIRLIKDVIVVKMDYDYD